MSSRFGAVLRSTPLRRSSTGGDEGRIASGGLGRTWQERQSSQENMYFSKEDEMTMKRLANKLSKQVAPSPEQLAENRTTLAAILKKHGVQAPAALVEDLLAFKYGGVS